MIRRKQKKKIVVSLMAVLGMTIVGVITVVLLKKPTSDPRVGATNDQLHRIGIRNSGQGREFYDLITDQPFIFRGNNYYRTKVFPNGISNISDFVDGSYNHGQRQAALALMKQYQYNSLRIFIDEWYSVDNTGEFNPSYLNNLADFLKLCNDNQIYVLITFRRFPHVGTYRQPLPESLTPYIDVSAPYHDEYLTSFNIDARSRYITGILQSLKTRNVPFEAILGVTIDNEPYFDKTKAPFNLQAGSFTAPNGQTYLLPRDKQVLMDDSFAYALNTTRTNIKQVDPLLLVGMSTYPEGESNPNHSTRPMAFFQKSAADFIDAHIYDLGQNLNASINALGSNGSKIPIILGEYGTTDYAQTVSAAASVLKNLQLTTCNSSNFKGWFLYDWDSFEQDQKRHYWHAVEANGEINQALSPLFNPDPCSNQQRPKIIGNLDSISPSGLVTGWVYDMIQPSGSKVNFYIDQPYPKSDWSNLIGSINTSSPRPDVVNQYNWVSQTSGFSFSIPEQYLTDGLTHTLYAQAVNLQPNGQKTSFLVPGSGKSIPKAVPPAPEQIVFTTSCTNTVIPASQCVSQGKQYKAVVFTTGVNPSGVFFATWNTENGLDDLKKTTASRLTDQSWESVINSVDHPGSESIKSNIWYFDSSNKQQWCGSITVPICH